MTTMDRESAGKLAEKPDGRQDAVRARRLRGRNLAVLAALLALVVLFYAITVVRMSAGH